MLAVLSVSAAALLFAASFRTADAQIKGSASPEGAGTQFPGTGVGSIPDGPPATCQPTQGSPLNVTFNVTGITGAPSAVDVDMTFGSPNHSWMGDITAVLIAPNGASHTIFARTLATTATAAGDDTNLGGTYAFSNTAAAPPNGGWWQAATAATTAVSMPAGTYRTTATGGAGAVNPAPATDMNAAFAGVSNPNGTWTLRFTDGCAADTGAVTAANLTITGAAVPTDANVDFDGDGRTDFVVARGTNTPFAEGEEAESAAREMVKRPRSDLDVRVPRNTTRVETPQAPPIFWYTSLNTSGAASGAQWGDAATDFITPEDFDGDGRDDIAVWRETGVQGVFYILQSATGTARVDTFGLPGDDPAIVGDYDGDNKADPAVFRCPGIADPDGQCFFFYRGSNANPGGNITYAPWGFGVDGDFFPLVGDFDGDGKNDFCIQRANPSSPANGQFVLRKSSGGDEYINWGLSSDFLIPGDYDGDGKSDFCVRRTVAGARQHFILTRTGATSQVQWGVTGDASVPGDYDGDGKTDIAIWRGNTDSTQNFFWIRNSSNGSTTVREWGQCPTVATCDFAVAGWAVH